MTHEELNTSLYEKCFAAQEHYREWLLSLPPEEILNHTYEYTIREDILLALETNDLSDEQATALLSSPAPLDDVFHDFEQIEGDHMDLIRGCIETRADDILKDQREAALKQPVYKFPASYAKEHGETAEYHRRNLSGTCKAQTAGQLSQHFNRRRLHSHAPDMGRHCAGWDCRACDCAWKAEKKRQALSTITCKSAVEASSHPRRNPLLSSFGRVHTAFAQNP